MFVIVVYDVKEKRVSKALKVCRKYLYWVQNSVFEGELTGAQLVKFKSDIKKVLKEEEDSVVIYKFRTKTYFSRETIGIEKGGESEFF